MIARQSPDLCFICLRRPYPRGLQIKDHAVCAKCAPHAGGGLMMLIEGMDEAESEALLAGGDLAGQYLDSLEKTDLATLTPDEWSAFLARVLEGYSDRMRDIADETPPF